MKDINKEDFSDFESGWQKAFEDVEMSPGKDVWSNIDTNLANKETSKYKRKVAYYKWVAAASIVFAIGLSYFSLNNISKSDFVANENEIVKESKNQDLIESKLNENIDPQGQNLIVGEGLNDENEFDNSEKNGGAEERYAENKNTSEKDIEAADDVQRLAEKSKELSPEREVSPSEKAYGALAKNTKDGKEATLENDGNALTEELISGNELQVDGTLVDEDENKTTNENSWAASQASESNSNIYATASGTAIEPLEGYPYNNSEFLAELLDPPYIYSIPGVSVFRENKEEESGISVLWAGLNVGSGLFDPNFQEGSNFQPKTSPALFNSSSVAKESSPQEASFEESTDPGVSYSLGVNFGVRLTDKWVVQSGVAYAHKRASTNSTTSLQNIKNVSKTPAYLGDLTTASYSNALSNVTQDYQLMNSFEFISVPLKAGYLILDRKVGIMILGGLSADVFLSNTLSESDNKLEEVRVEAGSDSPFRKVNFNGVIGAEFSYEISENYHLTLEPNYGIALNPLTKSASSFSSNPQTFGISAGLKFYLK